MVTACALLVPLVLAAEPKLTFEGAPRHPTVSITVEDAERARKRIQSDGEAKAWFQSLQKSVAVWDARDPAWVRAVMPGKDACFAYGFTGCPICGATWGIWGAANTSFDTPGHVKCSNGHVLPDADHPDPGTGYVGPDKRIHYFAGSYNAWVVETLIHRIALPYANLYLLTHDERAGRMAAVILDEIAAIYPSCDKGSWDYPSNPPSGRLDRPWYQVARVLVFLVEIYDRAYDHPAMDEPSATPGLTRRQNIEKNLLLNGGRYCYEMSAKGSRLHNGEADYLRGVLAVGVVLGIPEYVTWPVDGPCGIRTMIANNADRDGQYFETSNGYALHTRNLYLTFAEPLLNYRGSVFPKGLNLVDDPRFRSFLLLPQMSYVCLGHDAAFGDDAPITKPSQPPYRPRRTLDYRFTEYLATRVSDPQERAEYAALAEELRSRDPDARKDSGDLAEWRVFHGRDDAAPAAAGLSERIKRLLDGSFIFGQKGMAVLRLGTGAAAQAAILRFGPALNHGHQDDLNVNYFAQGYELTYDIGYSLGSTHTQVGWAHQTASHDTVVVDEKSQSGGTTGGSLYHFVALPDLAMVEASSTVYAPLGVDTYRRLFAVADRYALDVFRVSGGRQHDLPLHSLGANVTFDGLEFEPAQTGSLAGSQYDWGELQLNDGDMKGNPNKPYWNPPPGNGYGFLVRPAFGHPRGNWSATWMLDDKDKTRFRIDALRTDGDEVVSAAAPGLYPTYPKARYVIRRRKGEKLSSCFVSLWQGATAAAGFPVKAIERIDAGGSPTAGSGVAVAVALADGKRDIWMLNPATDMTVTAKDAVTPLSLHGAVAACRMDGAELLSARMLDASTLKAGGWTLTLDAPHRSAAAVQFPANAPAIRIDTAWPDDGRYDGDALYVSHSRYSRNSSYTIDRIEGDLVRVQQTDTLLGRGVVHSIADGHTLTTKIAHEYAYCLGGGKPAAFFQGKRLQTEDGSAATNIRELIWGSPLTIRVDSTEGFKEGQAFRYHDVQRGDEVLVQHYVSLTRVSPRTYELRTNTDVTLAAPSGSRISYKDRSGRVQTADAGRIPRKALPRSGGTTVTLAD